MASPASLSEKSPAQFDWPLAYEAEQLLGRFIGAFLEAQ